MVAGLSAKTKIRLKENIERAVLMIDGSYFFIKDVEYNGKEI